MIILIIIFHLRSISRHISDHVVRIVRFGYQRDFALRHVTKYDFDVSLN